MLWGSVEKVGPIHHVKEPTMANTGYKPGVEFLIPPKITLLGALRLGKWIFGRRLRNAKTESAMMRYLGVPVEEKNLLVHEFGFKSQPCPYYETPALDNQLVRILNRILRFRKIALEIARYHERLLAKIVTEFGQSEGSRSSSTSDPKFKRFSTVNRSFEIGKLDFLLRPVCSTYITRNCCQILQ